jgi:hypothetical protein
MKGIEKYGMSGSYYTAPLGIRVAQPARELEFGMSWYTRFIGAAPGGGDTYVTEPNVTPMINAILFGFWNHTGGTHVKITSTGGPGGSGGGIMGTLFCSVAHPSGWKYGLMNFRRTSTSAVYRSDRYGQLRDQLEQRQYGKFYEYGDDINSVGLQDSPVTCIFVDSEGDPVSDPVTTSCQNLSNEMTSSVPYKEGETSRPPILNVEPVTITSLIG